LALYLPDSSKDRAVAIYADLIIQLWYAVGTPERDATIAGYGVAQKYMAIATTAVLPVVIIHILFWRHLQLRNVKLAAGTACRPWAPNSVFRIDQIPKWRDVKLTHKTGDTS
jgi:hypothetical protein